MRARTRILQPVGIACLAVVNACGGGGNDVNVTAVVNPPPLPAAPATEAVSAVGVISALGSITVNGVRYDTNAASVTMNGQPGNVSDLEVGQIVALEGAIEVDAPRGTADRVDFEATVLGPVETIDAALGQLVIMGQTVLTDTDTVFDQSIDPDSFSGLIVGSPAQVSGFLNANGDVLATLIQPSAASGDVRLIGEVLGLDLANMLFRLNRLTVDYGSAALIDLPDGMPADGMFVRVRGSLVNGILLAEAIESLCGSDGTPGERANVQGSITDFNSATDFGLNGIAVTTDAATAFADIVVDGVSTATLNMDIGSTLTGSVGTGQGVAVSSLFYYGTNVTVNVTSTSPSAVTKLGETRP